MELYVTVVVPKNVLALYCGRKADYSNAGDRYSLKDRDPEYLDKLLNLIYRAGDNQFSINQNKPENRRCKAALDAYNQANPGHELSQADLVRCVNKDNYKYSVLSTKQDKNSKHSLAGEELHVFKHVRVPGFATNRDNSLFIKIVDTDGAYPIRVHSLHRDFD